MIFEDLMFDNKKICVTNTHTFWNPAFDDIKYFQMVINFNTVMDFVGCKDANPEDKEYELQ